MYALNGLMSNDSGWTNIEVGSSAEIHCGDDYIFRYYVGAAGVKCHRRKKSADAALHRFHCKSL